jgi:GntR family transcriptional regulator, transcriptional repressor for pyruvate dehydrogenase complex
MAVRVSAKGVRSILEKNLERNPRKKKKPGALFAPLKTKRAFEEISAEIKRMIFSGVLKPGDRLPSEGELGSQFGVSRQTIREAVRRLELAGFIVIQKGASGGPLVVDTILNSIGDSFLDAFQMKKMTTDELTRARVEIEKMVVRNLFGVINKGDIASIRKSIEETKRKLAQGKMPFGDDLRFHKLLARATHNYVFVVMVESLMAVVAHYMSFVDIGAARWSKAIRAHELIIDAIEKGDESGAMKEMENHIRRADRPYRRYEKSRAGQDEPLKVVRSEDRVVKSRGIN